MSKWSKQLYIISKSRYNILIFSGLYRPTPYTFAYCIASCNE